MREELARAEPTTLASLFDVTATYDKRNRRLERAATVTPEPVAAYEKQNDRPGGRSRNCVIAGAGFEPATFGL